MKTRPALSAPLLVLALACPAALAAPAGAATPAGPAPSASPDCVAPDCPHMDRMKQPGGGMKAGMPRHEGMPMGHGMAIHNPDNLKWGDGPAALPKGVRLAVLAGDPGQAGPFVIRLKMPPGYKVPPHWHSKDENVTLISGMLALGMGDKADEKAAQVLRPGGFHSIAAGVHHFAMSRSGAVVQIHGEGPFDIQFVNPADDPRPPKP